MQQYDDYYDELLDALEREREKIRAWDELNKRMHRVNMLFWQLIFLIILIKALLINSIVRRQILWHDTVMRDIIQSEMQREMMRPEP